MRNIDRRLDKAEKALNISEKPKMITIVHFGDDLPPDRMEGNTTIHFIKYDELGEI